MIINEACLNYPVIILIIDPMTGKIHYANNKASTIYGYTREELCSLKIQDINILTNEQVKKEMQIAKNENRNYFHFPHKTKDGEIIEMEVESYPTLIDNKKFLFSTINPCKTRNYFNQIADQYFEKSDEGIIILDQSLRIINFNESFIKTFHTRKKIISNNILNIFKTDEIDKLKLIEKKIIQGEIANISIKILNYKNIEMHFNVFAIPTFFRDNFFGALISFKNISEEVIEQKRIADNYKKALEEAELFRLEKESFFTRMSHNMKTPLTAILSYSEFGQNEKENNEIKKYFTQINQSASYLLGLVNDLLELNVLEKDAIKLNNKPISKNILINRILGIIEPQLKIKNIKLITNFSQDIWPYHLFDIFRLEQIYLNILQNAIDFSYNNSTIIWTKKYLRDEFNQPYFYNEIQDFGIGINENFLKIMFDPYTREDDTSQRNGLGLAIVKNLIIQHNGQIWCESKKNEGTTIYFKIPANEISEEEFIDYNKKLNLNKKLANKKILICEDNPINSKIIEKILTHYSIICDYAKNGKIAIEKANKNKYFAIIMDIQMPIIDGYEATIEIRKKDKKTPIIALSTNFLESDLQHAKKIGMNDYLYKPIDKEKLLNTLSSYINK